MEPLTLKDKISLLPHLPGIYRFLNKEGVVIYVGKARNLKQRVASYFISTETRGLKTLALVQNITDVLHVVVESESDALLLENNFIKEHKPKYNILLKDDKSYPWIVVKAEQYPRIMQTRQVIKDGSQYFGPYSSVYMQQSILDVVRRLYSIRDCRLKLTEEAIAKGRFNHCLEFHIGNCKAPCTGNISKKEYDASISAAISILKGDTDVAMEYLRSEMAIESSKLRFESAQKIKDKIVLLEGYKSKSIIVTPTHKNLDVFSLIYKDKSYYCNYLHVVKGAVVNSMSLEFCPAIEEKFEDVFAYAIQEVMNILEKRLSREVLVSAEPNPEFFENNHFIVPQRGDNMRLMELSLKNCKIFMISKLKHIENKDPERHIDRVMNRMKEDLQLDKQPRHIECFDNSNIQGHFPVSACVVFIDGKPAKRMYRHFDIQSVVGIDDFASMHETITRRYTRVIAEGSPLPDLIVVDGGKGQLSASYAVLKSLGIHHKVPIIGLAKRLEEVFFPNNGTPYHLDKSSETLRVLMHIRNEAHRFGITFHRNKRSKAAINSDLANIPFVGERSTEKLLKSFRTVAKIKVASVEELNKVVDIKKAQSVYNYFNKKNSNEGNI